MNRATIFPFTPFFPFYHPAQWRAPYTSQYQDDVGMRRHDRGRDMASSPVSALGPRSVVERIGIQPGLIPVV